VLDASFVPGTTPFDDAANRHGTAVAGIAAAKGNDGFGVAGVAWNVTPVSIKVLDSNGGGSLLQLGQGIDRARVMGYPIVNMSLTIPRYSYNPEPPAADLAALNDVCYNSFIAGSFLVAAAGNTGQGLDPPDPFNDPFFNAYPAAFRQRVFAVGAILPDGNRWRDYAVAPEHCPDHAGDCLGSNHGSWLDVLAPGGRFIVTTRSSTPPDTFYHLRDCNSSILYQTGFGGTSAAAPFVSGSPGFSRALCRD
jgi:subtilisin family serine protease